MLSAIAHVHLTVLHQCVFHMVTPVQHISGVSLVAVSMYKLLEISVSTLW